MTTKRGNRCKSKKWKKSPFCFSHRFLGPLAITLAGIFWGPTMYYSVYGKLIIDFKEDDITINQGIPSVRIELLNLLGNPLTFVDGTVTLSCLNSFQRKSKTFQLEGGRDFLAHGSRSELLFSPDPFFVNLIETKKSLCSDANVQIAHYIKINKSHAELMNVDSFEFFLDDDLEIIKKQYTYPDKINSSLCISCNVTINIDSFEKSFSKIENHKFVSGYTEVQPFKEVIKPPKGLSLAFARSHFGYILSFKPCNGFTSKQCGIFLCGKIQEKYNLSLKCEEVGPGSAVVTPLFSNRKLNF
jgi:hypothetical protein